MSASYWTPKTKSTLRQLAVRLEKTQFDGTIYKRLPQSNSHAESYVLSPYHELKLANDLAYLACTEEGVKRISAVCVEEGRNCLTVLVASNETPIPKTVAALQKIGNAISSYAIRGKSIFQAECVVHNDFHLTEGLSGRGRNSPRCLLGKVVRYGDGTLGRPHTPAHPTELGSRTSLA